MPVQASNCRNTREIRWLLLLPEYIHGPLNKGNIGKPRELMGRDPMAQQNPREGAEEAEAGGG